MKTNLKSIRCLAAGMAVLSALAVVPAFAANESPDTGTVTAVADAQAEPRTYKYIVVGNNVNVRVNPTLNSIVLGQMNWGDVVYDTGRFAEADGYHWTQVRCGAPLTGTIGWIASDYLRQDPND